MPQQNPKRFEYTGTHIEKGAVEDGTRIFVRGGDLIVEGPVGDNVLMEADGNIVLKADAGKSLRLYALGDASVQNVGSDARITAAAGKATAVTLGENGSLSGKFGAAVTSENVKCGDHQIFLQDGIVSIYRKPAPRPGDAPRDLESCLKPIQLPKTPRH